MDSKQSNKVRQVLGNKLKKARENAKLTQAEVADKAEIHVNYYARIERGEENPSFEILHNIAKALKIKSSEILPI